MAERNTELKPKPSYVQRRLFETTEEESKNFLEFVKAESSQLEERFWNTYTIIAPLEKDSTKSEESNEEERK